MPPLESIARLRRERKLLQNLSSRLSVNNLFLRSYEKTMRLVLSPVRIVYAIHQDLLFSGNRLEQQLL